MQVISYKVKKMRSKRLSEDFCGCYMIAFTLLEVLGKTHMSVHDSNHAYIQANSNDVRFMGVHEGLKMFMHKDVASSNIRISHIHKELDRDDAFSTSTYLKFVPPQLDFKERHLGVPHLEKVTLVNTDVNKTIHMSSVSGNTLHFHSSFFQDKTIPPKGNTTFAVVFLGRAEGQVSSNLYIHTSEGIFKYQVSGASVCSPYRLRPLSGVRLPLNAAFQPLIQLHNPHHYPIQVVEVYSSGSEFHLELPGGEMEGPKALWEVPPFSTKPVIRAKFHANAQSNHTAYIRLKLNNSEEVLIVPLEVEVTSHLGLYSHQHLVDFGIGGSWDEPKRIRLYICSTLKKGLRVQSVTAVPATSALKINYLSAKIPPESSPVEVAELIFDWKIALETKQTSGKILIKTKQNQYKLVVPFMATVLEGGLKINDSTTRFLITEGRHFPRNLTVKNQFKIPIAINNISLFDGASNYFEMKNFNPLIIPASGSATILSISLKNNLKESRLDSGMILYTNVSDVKVPLLIYSGKLTKIFPRGFEDLELLDIGLMACGSTKNLKLGLQNNNPVPIEIKSLESDSTFISAHLLGILSKSASEFLSQHNFTALKNSTILGPNDIIVIELVIRASGKEEILAAQVTVSSQHEKLIIPLKASVARGSLQTVPTEIVLDDCFPFKICTRPLKIQSTFNRPMTVISITSVPLDDRLSFASVPGGSEILPNTITYVGDLRWEPGKNCAGHCYLGISVNTSANDLQWMQNEVLPSYVSDLDATLLRDRYHRLLNLTNGFGSGHWRDLILKLDTNEVREELFKAKIKFIWPKFSSASKLVFPLTQVTNTSVVRLKLFNSASHTVIMQLVAEWGYPQPKRLLDSFPPSFRSNLRGNCVNASPKEFYISQGPLGSPEPLGKMNATLAPGESFEVTIAYTPQSPQKSCSTLFLRNNLTVIEVIEVEGQASYAQLKFGNRKPGSDNPLIFEISEKHLKDCQRERSKKIMNPNFTVKRSFTVRNMGELPIFIHNFYINGLECEGYGFAVLNCGSFSLPSNATKKIDVAFTPDFTLTKVERILTIDTSLGVEVNYTLITTLPPLFLSACSSVLSRPTWEPLLYYSAVSFMLFLLFCVLAAAFFESDRILKCALMTLARDKTAPPLDLKQIGTNVLKEFNQFNQGATGKKPDAGFDHADKGRQKEGAMYSTNWSLPDDRPFGNEKLETHVKTEDSLKEKDNSPLFTVQSVPIFNNLSKNKKKLGKRNSNNSDTAAETVQDNFSNKKKEKNFANAGWCSVFARGTTERVKVKVNAVENSNIRAVKNDAEVKKEDIKKDERKISKSKKNFNKEATKEEEETSSTTTDSSNDAETSVQNSDASMRIKSEKLKKLPLREQRTKVLHKESTHEGNRDDEDLEKDKKHFSKNSWKVNVKSIKLGNISDNSISLWKSSSNDGQKNLDFTKQKITKNTRDRKEKTVNRKRFTEKAPLGQKMAEPSTIHRRSPCWEHRSFSEVVARNDSPLSYSSIVSARSHQRKQLTESEPIYTEAPEVCDASASLGPIGSKKPLSQWSPFPYNATGNSVFQRNFSDTSAGFFHSHSLPSGFPGENIAAMEDSLPTDSEILWEDQHSVMQLMHQQDANYQSWKENCLDYLWCSNRNVHQSDENMAVQDNFSEQSWSSLFRSSWGSPTTWSPSSTQALRTPVDNGASRHFSDYNSLAGDGDRANIDMAASLGQNSSMFGQNPFNRAQVSSSNSDLPQGATRQNFSLNGLQFDPFHSLNSIWSPKSQNSWNSAN